MITCTKNPMMTLAFIFVAFCDGHSSDMFDCLQLDRHSGGFIVSLLTGISADQSISGQ